MTNKQVLIDSSVWAEYLKGRNANVVQSVRELITGRRAIACGIVISEIVAGLRSKEEQEALKHDMGALEYAEMSLSTWMLAGTLSGSLKRQGKAIPLTDAVIASLALERDAELFTLDSHFDRVPKLKRFHQKTI